MDLSLRLSKYLDPDRVSRKRDLVNSLQLLEKLGNPHKKLPPTFHVAGTNGKGSTVAMLKSVLQAANYVVHTYTSPHLVDYNERIEIAGRAISDTLLDMALNRVETAVEALHMHPSFFEVLTAAAMLVFAENKADALLLETGLGGRLDCTNVVEQPLVTLITPISNDHTEHLGDTLEAIAYEKAGIIKPGTPCVISHQAPSVYDVLLQHCRSAQAEAVCYDTDFWYKSDAKQLYYHTSHSTPLQLPLPKLLGEHQYINASGVVAALQAQCVLPVRTEHLAKGLCTVKWPGRLQKISAQRALRLVGVEADIYIDGAHNDQAAYYLNNWIQDHLSEHPYLILGMKRSKDPASFCKRLQAVQPWGVAVPVPGSAGHKAQDVAERASQRHIQFAAADSLLEGLQSVLSKRGARTTPVLITGSLHLVGAFLQLEKSIKG